MAAAIAEPYDAKGSGLTGGFALGATASLALGMAIMLMGQFGATPGFVTDLFNGNVLIWLAILGGATILFGIIGFFVAGRS